MTEAPSHEIRRVAFQQVPPSLAHTLAECLFWYQKATHKIEGELAVWKTGPDLCTTLGIKPRTANEHMKRLERAGYWRLLRKPRPNHSSPSPVTWFIPSAKGLALLQDALAGQAPAQTAKAVGGKQSSGHSTDTGMSAELTDLSLSGLPSLTPDFTSQTGTNPKAKSKSAGNSPKKYGEDAPEDIKAFVKSCQDHFIAKNLPTWDLSSKYTWQHAETFYRCLEGKGVATLEMTSVVHDLMDWWGGILYQLPHAYRWHTSNVGRPSPRALGDQADLTADLLLALRASSAAKAASKAANSSKYSF